MGRVALSPMNETDFKVHLAKTQANESQTLLPSHSCETTTFQPCLGAYDICDAWVVPMCISLLGKPTQRSRIGGSTMQHTRWLLDLLQLAPTMSNLLLDRFLFTRYHNDIKYHMTLHTIFSVTCKPVIKKIVLTYIPYNITYPYGQVLSPSNKAHTFYGLPGQSSHI